MRFLRNFRPQGTGLGKILGELECDIMAVVWEAGPCSVKDVTDVLNGRGRKAAYTTVMTVMGRLAEKELLHKTPVANKYIYRAAYSRDEVMDMISHEVLTGLFKEDHEPVLTHLGGMLGDLDAEELDRLKREVDEAIDKKDR